MITVSNSRLKTWKNNHYDHYMKYVKRLVPKAKSGPLVRGNMIHECLEAYYNGKSWTKTLDRLEAEYHKNTFAEERAEMGDIPKMARELLEAYFLFYEEEDADTEYLENELHFKLPLTEEIEIEGYIDAVIKDPEGKIWVKDYKTYKSMKDYSFFHLNTQSAIYIWAMEQLGYEVQGVIWDVIKAKEPSKPQILKSGKLSSRRLDSTPYTVEKGILELGLNPEDYQDFIDSHRYEDFFVRHAVRLNRTSVDFLMADVEETALQILERGDTTRDMNLGGPFRSPYMEIWEAEALGLDTEFIIKRNFETRERRPHDEKK